MRSVLTPVVLVAATSLLLAGCGGGEDAQWSESALARATLDEVEGKATVSWARLVYKPNLNDIHGEDGALARAMRLGDDKVEARVRRILLAAGRKDLESSDDICLTLVKDVAFPQLPATRHRRPLPPEPGIISVTQEGYPRVSTGKEKSMLIPTNEEIETLARMWATVQKSRSAQAERQHPHVYEVKQVRFKRASETGGDGPSFTPPPIDDLSSWAIEVDSRDQWRIAGSAVERAKLAEQLERVAPPDAEAALVRLADNALHSDLVAVLDQLARQERIKLVGLSHAKCRGIVWVEIVGQDLPLPPRTMALKADGRVRSQMVHEILDALNRGEVGSVTVLTTLDVRDRAADFDTFPGALPGGIELLLEHDIARNELERRQNRSRSQLSPASNDDRPVDGPVRFSADGPVTEPVRVSGPRPKRSEAARNAGISGVVVLEALISTRGEVTDLKVLSGLPLGLTESAVAAVRQWRFRPATLDGRPVEVYYTIPVRFDRG
jgi:TonB family protein